MSQRRAHNRRFTHPRFALDNKNSRSSGARSDESAHGSELCPTPKTLPTSSTIAPATPTTLPDGSLRQPATRGKPLLPTPRIGANLDDFGPLDN